MAEGGCKRCDNTSVKASGCCTKCYHRYETPIRRCVNCGEMKHHQARGLCWECYRTPPRSGDCASCGRWVEHRTRDLCAQCYRLSKPEVACAGCGEICRPVGKGICHRCYHKERPIRKCEMCGEMKPYKAKGCCQRCYQKYRAPKSACRECGELKRHHARGLCGDCHQRFENPIVSCFLCGEDKPHAAKGLCRTCYYRQREQMRINELNDQLTLVGAPPGPERVTSLYQRYVHRVLEYLIGDVAKPDDRVVLKPHEIDVWFASRNIGFEFQGHPSHWMDVAPYNQPNGALTTPERDALKVEKAANLGVHLIPIPHTIFAAKNPLSAVFDILRAEGVSMIQTTIDEPDPKDR